MREGERVGVRDLEDVCVYVSVGKRVGDRVRVGDTERVGVRVCE